QPPVEGAASVVGEAPAAVEPVAAIQADTWVFLMVLGTLSAGSVLLTRRYRLLQTRPTGHGRYDAMTAAMLPTQPGQPPLNLGLILVLSAMGVWVLSMMAAAIRFSLAAQGDPDFEPTLGLSAQAYG